MAAMAVAALVALGCGGDAPTGLQSTSRLADFVIAYHLVTDGKPDILVQAADGGPAVNLTNHPAADFAPAFSPDGREIAFVSSRDGGQAIFVMRSDGTGVRRLTDVADDAIYPAWSPDGRRIAFVSHRRSERGSIAVMNGDGTDVRILTDSSAIDSHPTWSPDGRRIAFQADRSDASRIWTIDLDGGSVRQLTRGLPWDPGLDVDPSWSPDGTLIAFMSTSGVGGPGQSIFAVRPDGSGRRQFTDAYDAAPSWSPDGAWIAFLSIRSGIWQLYVRQREGGPVRRVTSVPRGPRLGGASWARRASVLAPVP